MKREIKKFNVINAMYGKLETYDIMPYLIGVYKNDKTKKWKNTKKPETFNDFKEYIKKTSMYQWWGRCEYEILISDWPCQRFTEKWDIHQQVMMNIDIITEIFLYNINQKITK